MAQTTVRRGLRWLRPHRFETVSVVSAVLTIGYLRWRGLDYGWNTIRHSFPSLFALLPQLLLEGVVLQSVARLVLRQPVRPYFRGLGTWRWFGLWWRLWVVSAINAYTYMWLKVSVPLLRPQLLDAELWRLDRWLHFGVSPTVLAIELVAGTPVARWIDVLYGWWVPSVPLVLAYAYASLRDLPRRNLALANTVLWVTGAWIYLALPAVGPCYFSPDVLDPIRESMPSAMGGQAHLWSNYLTMVRSRGAMLESFSPLLGVAAMPSLHVGAYAMFMFWARRHARRWFWPFVVGTAIIFFGSLATGWHYAVDGYAGVLLAWMAVCVADRFEPVPEDGMAGARDDAASQRRSVGGGDASPAVGAEGGREG